MNTYWILVVRKYPHLANEDTKTTLSVRGLRKLIEQAYEQGKADATVARRSTPMPDFFKGFFG